MRKRSILAALSGLLMGTAALAPARAEQKLRVADSFPHDHYIIRQLLEPWMEAVTKRTNGAVTFDHFPAQQMGKAGDLLALTQAGAIDIGYIAPSYASDKMPVSAVAELPGAFKTSCQGTLAYWKLARDGVIATQDFKGNRIRILLALVLPQYHILTARTVIRTMDDARGLKLRTTGGAQDLTLRTLGAVPVRMAAPDAYEALSRGTMDGLLFPLESVVSYGMDRLVKQSTLGVGFGSFVATYSISESLWNRLSPEVREAMTAAADDIVPKTCAQVQKAEGEYQQRLADRGVSFNQLSPEVAKKFEDALSKVGMEWAANLDKRGKAGGEALKAFTAAVAALPPE